MLGVNALSGGGGIISQRPRLLMHFDGTNGSTAFTDEAGNTVTANGNAQISTAHTLLAGQAGMFDGSGDYLVTGGAMAHTPRWTLEGWLRNDNVAKLQIIVQHSVPSVTQDVGTYRLIISGSKLNLLVWGSGGVAAINITGATTLANSTVYHWGITRDGDNWYLALAGGIDASGSASLGATVQNTGLYIGRDPNNSTRDMQGKVDEIRMVDLALYTGTYTVPATPFTM